MINVIKQLLLKIIDDIDAGNSHIDEKSALDIIKNLKELSSKDTPISKYQACKYINMSRASFDNYIRAGKLPKGQKIIGFTELVWFKKDLDESIRLIKK